MTKIPCALTIAGSDSGGGAGIQADLRTFAALQVYGASAITAVTSQNTREVRSFVALDPAFVASQMDAVLDDLPITAAKTGMLANAGIVAAVAAVLRGTAIPVVVDPVMISKSGAALLDDEAVDALRTMLLPRATIVTPNLPEAQRLCGFDVIAPADQERAARALVDRCGAQAALVKGGHARGDPVDVLYDGVDVHRLTAPRLETRHTHGTGCTYAAAVCARLAQGEPLVDAVRTAHAYVRDAIASAPGLGHGAGPLHHMHPWYEWP